MLTPILAVAAAVAALAMVAVAWTRRAQLSPLLFGVIGMTGVVCLATAIAAMVQV